MAVCATFEAQISALKQQLQQMEEDHAMELEKVDAQWSKCLQDKLNAHKNEKIDMTNDFENRLMKQKLQAQETEDEQQEVVRSLQAELKDERRTREDVETALNRSELALAEATDRLLEHGEVIKRIMQERDQLRGELAERGEQITMLKGEVEVLKDALAGGERTISDLHSQLSKLSERHQRCTEEWEARNRQLGEQLGAAMWEAEQAKAELERVDEKHNREKEAIINDFELRLLKLQADAQAVQDSLQEQINDLTSQVNRERRGRKSAEEEVARAAAEAGEMRSALQDAQDEIEALKAELESLKEQIRSAERVIEGLERNNKGLMEELRGALLEVDEYKKQIERIRHEAEAKYSQLIAQIERITGEKVTLDDSLTVEHTATQRLKSEVDRLLATIKALHKIAEEGEHRKARIAELEAELALRNARIAELEDECDGIQKQAERRHSELCDEIGFIDGIKRQKESDLNAEQSITSSLRQQIQALLQTIEDLKDLAAENEAAKARIRELEADVAHLQALVFQLEQQVEELQLEINSSGRHRIEGMEAEIQRLHGIIRSLEKRTMSYSTEWSADSYVASSPPSYVAQELSSPRHAQRDQQQFDQQAEIGRLLQREAQFEDILCSERRR